MKKKYSVVLFPTVKVRVDGIEAESQEEAIEWAMQNVDLSAAVRDAEYADDVPYALVDEEGDEDHLKSKWYGWDGEWREDKGYTHP